MTWYKKRETKSGELSHPADGDEWKEFDRRYPTFARESRNIRLGLGTDGFCPFSNYGKKVYSVWPVVVVVYNLPPSMSMKKPYTFMTLLIPGEKSPARNLNVYLRPLINELKLLWSVGVETFDQSLKQNFTMRAAVMWTITDFPGLGMVSGWSTHGKLSCPVCVGNIQGIQLKKCGKCSFFGTSRCFLPKDDPLRLPSTKFASEEKRVFVGRSSGEYLKNFCEKLEFPPPGRKNKDKKSSGFGVAHNWTHISMFYELPYWSSLSMRHCIDVMHTEKNVFDNVFYTIINDINKTKDHKKARLDCKLMNVMPELWISENGKMPKASFTLTKPQLKIMCEWFRSLKLPDGYASNIGRCCKDNYKFSGFKSHDCHIIMQRLLPHAIRELLPSYIVDALSSLSNFFHDICSSTLIRDDLKILEKSIVRTMVVLETFFPPSFFDSMEHLVLHLAEECRLGGPVNYRWMYFVERMMGYMKHKVRNKARVEGSIAERYVEEEMLNFCSFYFDSKSNTVHNQLRRNEVVGGTHDINELEVFAYPISTTGKHRNKYLTDDERLLAEKYVLLNSPEVQPYIQEYETHVKANQPNTSPEELERLLKTEFKSWFATKVENDDVNGPRFKFLLLGPAKLAMLYEICTVNGYKFYTKSSSNYGRI